MRNEMETTNLIFLVLNVGLISMAFFIFGKAMGLKKARQIIKQGER
jgi:hypothetical protein